MYNKPPYPLKKFAKCRSYLRNGVPYSTVKLYFIIKKLTECNLYQFILNVRDLIFFIVLVLEVSWMRKIFLSVKEKKCSETNYIFFLKSCFNELSFDTPHFFLISNLTLLKLTLK